MKLIYIFCLLMFFSFVCAENNSVTSSDAQVALDNSLSIISEFSANSFPTEFINDTYQDSFILFQQINYAEILNNKSIPETDPTKIMARSALRLVNWKNLSYSQVIYLTEKISEHKNQAYDLYDAINSLDKKIMNYSAQGVNISLSLKLLHLANNTFYLDQFSDTQNYIDQTKVQLELDREKISSLSILKENAKNFFYRFWYMILSILILLLIVYYFAAKKMNLSALKNKILKMETEEKVLLNLIKKNQTERFKENKISGIVYNIRMKKYAERLSDIRKELPFLKNKLAKKK